MTGDSVLLVMLIAAVAAAVGCAHPLLSIPAAIVVAATSIGTGSPLWVATLSVCCGLVAARLFLALAAMRGDGGSLISALADGDASAMRRLADRIPFYNAAAFAVGAMPLVPAWVTFPLLGSTRLPVSMALLGSFVGRFPIVLGGAWVASVVAQAVTPTANAAAMLLVAVATTIAVIGIMHRMDPEAWSTSRRIRIRPDIARRRSRFVLRLGSPWDIEGSAVEVVEEDVRIIGPAPGDIEGTVAEEPTGER